MQLAQVIAGVLGASCSSVSRTFPDPSAAESVGDMGWVFRSLSLIPRWLGHAEDDNERQLTVARH